MSKLTKKERLLHSLIGIKQLFNNLGVEDLKNEIVLKDGTTETIDCYKEISLEQAIVFLEMNAYEGSNAKAVLRMGDVHEVLKPIKGLIDKSVKMESYIKQLERENKRLLKREEPQEPCMIEGKKFCPACGDELTDVDPGLFEYCFYCGTKLY